MAVEGLGATAPKTQRRLVLLHTFRPHSGLDWLLSAHLLEDLIMHQSAHSRHRALGRRLPEPGVPLEAACEESRAIGAPTHETCENSSSSGSNTPVVATSEPRADASGSSEGKIHDFDPAPGPKLAPLSEAATSTPQPSLFAEADVECPLCCRLLFTPITTRCGTLHLASDAKKLTPPNPQRIASMALLLESKATEIPCFASSNPLISHSRAHVLQNMLHDRNDLFFQLSIVSSRSDCK